jgi:hypothetical protein
MSRSSLTRRAFLSTAGLASVSLAAKADSPARKSKSESDPPGGLRVRRNVDHMDWNGPEFKAFREGVRVMKTRAPTDPTSWVYQAAIHGTLQAVLLPLQKTCTHHTYYFFPWHRAYLHYFERILCAAAGATCAALPYWNYSVLGQAALPEPFTTPPTAAAPNPLYFSPRDMTGTDEIDALTANYMPALDALEFTSNITTDGLFISRGFGGGAYPTPAHSQSASFYGGTLENSVHDGVHGAVGGAMNNPEQSANDPIFWLHHANIDRLWNRWIEMGEGRSNPTTDSVWMNTSYNFFDETAAQVSIQSKAVLNTLDLNYRYDDDPCPPARVIPSGIHERPHFEWRNICARYPFLCELIPLRVPGPPDPGPLQHLVLGRTQGPITLGDSPVVLPFTTTGRQLEQLQQFITNEGRQAEIDFGIDAVDPAPGHIVRVEVQRVVGRARAQGEWIPLGQAAFFLPAMTKGVVTSEINVAPRLRELLRAPIRDGELLAWRLRRVSGRQTSLGSEIPPRTGSVQIRQARLVIPAAIPARGRS